MTLTLNNRAYLKRQAQRAKDKARKDKARRNAKTRAAIAATAAEIGNKALTLALYTAATIAAFALSGAIGFHLSIN